MSQILMLYSTNDGQSKKISEYIQKGLIAKGLSVDIRDFAAKKPDIAEYDGIIIGASIRYGRHNAKLKKWIIRYCKDLQYKKSAFFSVNLVARKPEKSTPETNPLLQKFLSKILWKPDIVDVFAGKLDYAIIGPVDAFFIRIIMRMTGGPLETPEPIEYTDWKRVDVFIDHYFLLIHE